VPEDADLLIEGTETGQTLTENNLRAIDLLFRSSLCLIVRRGETPDGAKRTVFQEIVGRLREVSRTEV
jgi:ATP phosphoribosyltransferase